MMEDGKDIAFVMSEAEQGMPEGIVRKHKGVNRK
jgi:hypothetical protein